MTTASSDLIPVAAAPAGPCVPPCDGRTGRGRVRGGGRRRRPRRRPRPTPRSPRSAARSSTTRWCSSATSASTPTQQVAFSRRLRPAQPGALHRADRRAPRGDRRRARGVGDAALHVRQPVALRLLVPARAAVRVDPARARSAALRRRHHLREPDARVRRRCRPACARCSTGLAGVHSAVNAYSPKMQAVHDTFAGMTVQTDDDRRTRTQVHPVVRVHGETGTARAVRQRAVHRRARRVRAAEATAAARLPVRPRHRPRVHVPVALARSATSRCGTTAPCSTWRWPTSPATAGRCTAPPSPATDRFPRVTRNLRQLRGLYAVC